MKARPWRPAILHATAVASPVLALYVYWFAIADRYIVFLYFHPMGPRVPDTSPFSPVTSSRYWMAGFVADGAALLLYTAAMWAVGRLRRPYVAPTWWRVWAISAAMVVIVVPALTMTAGDPVLPALEAAKTTAAAMAGLTLVCVSGQVAATSPRKLAWLALDGIGLMLLLLLGGVFYWPLTRAGLSREQLIALVPLVGLVAAALWLLGLTWLRHWRRAPDSSGLEMLAAGLAIAYLEMPLVHHVLFTDGYFYITNSDNFIDRNGWRQASAWLLAAGLAIGAWRFRAHLTETRRSQEPGAR